MRPFRARALPAPVLVLALLAACQDTSAPLEVDPATPMSAPRMAVVEEFHTWDPALWIAGDHPLGRGLLDPANVAAAGGTLALHLAAGRYDGAEIRSRDRVGHGSYTARLRTPYAPGSLSAFFLYQGVPGDQNDEVDVEIFNDGSRRIMFTVWTAGKEVHNVTRTLPFDPAAAFHDYRIEHASNRVRFVVDGRVMQEWKSRLPRNPMYVMSNAWWPNWLSGPVLSEPLPLLIDRITY